jgi:hypothetical protein
MNKGHKLEKIIALALLFFSLTLLAGFLPLRFGPLDRAVENALKDASADSVSVGEVSVILWSGVRVKDLTAYKRISAKEDYRASVPRADISCNLFGMGLALLTNPNVLKAERDLFREAYESPVEFVGDACALAVSLGPLKKVAVKDVGVRFTRYKGKGKSAAAVAGVSAEGVSAAVSIQGRGHKRALNGSVSVKSASVPPIAVVENFRVKLRAADGRLGLTGGSGVVFGGELSVDASLDLDSSRLTGGTAQIKGLDLEKYCAKTDFSPGRLGGKVDIDVLINESPSFVLDSIRAKGSFKAANLTASDIGLQRTQAVNQLSKELRSLGFWEVRGDFRLDKGKIRFGEIAAAGDVLKFKSTGWADFDGRLEQNFEGELSQNFTEKLPKLVRSGLEKTENGGGGFKCRITGTFHKPRVEVDKGVYNRAFKNLFK